MKVNVYPFPSAVMDKRYSGKIVIVIDILRATTSMLQALLNGAYQVIPARDAEEAKAFVGNWNRKEGLLAGESGGLRRADFDLGNSPLDFTREQVEGKNLVFCTTNGTNAILSAKLERSVYLGCLRNRVAVARQAVKDARENESGIMLLCAGTEGECSGDDIICAGGILQAIRKELDEPIEHNDFALMCAVMYRDWKKGELDLNAISHYRRLSELGFNKDLEFCFEEDCTDRVPVYKNGIIQLL